MNDIVVPTNFDDISANAISYAAKLARPLRAGITLFHTYIPVPFENTLSEAKWESEANKLEQQSEKKLRKQCEEITNEYKINCGYHFALDKPEEGILKYLKESKPDLMVIGTHSLKAIDKVLFGTVTGSVIKNTPCATLVVPQQPSYKQPKNIGFAVDYHFSDYDDIKTITAIASKFGATTHLIHIITNEDDLDFEKNFFNGFKAEVNKRHPDENIKFRLLKGNDVVAELQEYVLLEDIDMLAVTKTYKGPIEKFIKGSTTQKLFNHINIPLLIFQEQEFTQTF